MKKLFLLTFTVLGLLTVSCNSNQQDNDPMAETGRTQRTENLLASLKELSAQDKFMFGHQDDVVYGIGWVGDSARSDVKSVCGDYPALLGFDLGRLETGSSKNLDGVDFDRIRQEIINQYERGGVTSLSWHCYNPLSDRQSWVEDSLLDVESTTVASILGEGETHDKFISWLDLVAQFLNSLETADGVKVPVIFRPWHEHTGSWFWWGQNNCTTDDYKALWRLTVDRLREQGVVNALYAYSTGTESGGDPDKFMERYPGDDYIDLIGLDFYCASPNSEEEACAQYLEKAEKHVSMVCQLAKEHGKAAAVTETGYEGIKTSDWWTKTLLPAVAQYPISYLLVWRNAHDKEGHFYAPYPGHSSASDFVNFYKDEHTLFAGDMNGLYEAK
ncbi:MAG: beta-mannosidase [Prevotellaceae bacterium]|nr:beta-mannosidase [Candidatus Minthosoma caballi]